MRTIGWFLILSGVSLHLTFCRWHTWDPSMVGGGALLEATAHRLGAVWSSAEWGVAILARGGNVALATIAGMVIPICMIVTGACFDYAGAQVNRKRRQQRRRARRSRTSN